MQSGILFSVMLYVVVILETSNGWSRVAGELKNRWLHSDIKDMAYFYVYKLFLDFKEKGGF